MHKKKLFSLFVMMVILLVACKGKDTEEATIEESDGFQEEGFPIVDDTVSLDFITGKAPTTADDYNEVTVWKNYNKMTNIDIDWGLVEEDALEEKRNLALGGDSLPDVFYSTDLPNDDLIKYGEQGVFVELSDLIEEYMPNLTEVLEENPDIRKGITFPDGHIYGLPTVYDPDFSSLLMGSKPWINQEWLNKLDMDMPETTDEFYEYLKAVKDTELIGNGEGDEIPFGGIGIDGLRIVLSGAFGINNNGIEQYYVDTEEGSDDLRFIPTTDEYKEMLEYMHKLYDEGLIQENIFSVDTEDSYAMGEDGRYGSVFITSPTTVYGEEAGEEFVGLPALEGPNGDKKYAGVRSPLISMGGFSITKENDHIPETLRWMDYFYSDEGTEMYFMGEEGETFEETDDGEVEYVDEIVDSDDDQSMEQNLKPHITWLGGRYPGMVKEEYFQGAESTDESIEAADKIEPDLVEELLPEFTYTTDESKKVTSLASDIEKYVDEMMEKFVKGEESLDEWDDYIEKIEHMNLDEYMEMQQEAYERYEDN